MNQSKHIPYTEHVCIAPLSPRAERDGLRTIQDKDGWPICNAFTATGADQIIRAFNSHETLTAQRDALLTACKEILEMEGEGVDNNRYGTGDEEKRVFNQARAAIALCEKEGK